MQDNDTKGKVISGLVWKFSERILAQLVTFLVGIILARLLVPSDYGSVSLVMVFISIADVLISYSFGNSLIQKENSDNIDFSSVFFFNIAGSVFIYILLFLFSPYIAAFYKLPELNMVIRVLGLRIIIIAVNSVQQAYVSKNMLFKKFFYSTLGGTAAAAVTGVVMAYKGYGVWALVVQYLVNAVIDTVILWFTVGWRPQLVFSYKRMKQLFRFGWKLLVSGIIDRVYAEFRSLLIGRLYTSEDLAFYKRGQSYPELIVNNINSSISSVFFPAVAKEQNYIDRVKAMTRMALSISSYVVFPCMVGLAVVADQLIEIMLTPKWLPCVPFLRIFCFTFALQPIHTANLDAIKAIGRSDLFLKMEILKKGVGLVILLLTVRGGVYWIALGMAPAALISSCINAYPNKKLLNYGYAEQYKDLLPSAAMSFVLGAAVWLLKKTALEGIPLLFAQTGCGITVYIGLSIVTKNKNFKLLSDSISNAIRS